MSTYVYGIVHRTHPGPTAELVGVGEPPLPVRTLAEGELLAIVSDAPDALRPKRRDLLAHQRVLSEASATGAVLPMRFGGISPDDAAVKAVLAERAEHFQERLAALRGKVEYNVKATHDEEALLHRVLSDQPELRAMSEANRAAGGGTHEQKLQLGERIVAVVQQQELIDADRLHQELVRVAEAVSVGPESGGWLASISCLVSQEDAESFIASVNALAKANPQLSLQINGPLPPYSFVE
ncbi:GvpL/GvpF family gas vesicle protein [Streptomyces sp. NBC_01619]|uniref:GvpL/GvpF family gas vesicle protein n=1 Tax=Streptomyces sp. NBC_01619 TaxID=2975901 RepID=UPI002252A160|nr:GvpL/GvpF family gas vesicle protein [Streptomyces sp. NBC_01619]MCX4513756.1 GvpL/GvpF family gas vesicle protein [Streptomyces sp. NBC_01619]